MGGSGCHIWMGEMQVTALEEKQGDPAHLQLDLQGATTSSMNLVLKCFGSAAPMSTRASAPSTADTFMGSPKSCMWGTVNPLPASPSQPRELVKHAWVVRCNTWSSPTRCGCIWILGVMISSWSPTPSLDPVPQLISSLWLAASLLSSSLEESKASVFSRKLQNATKSRDLWKGVKVQTLAGLLASRSAPAPQHGEVQDGPPGRGSLLWTVTMATY